MSRGYSSSPPSRGQKQGGGGHSRIRGFHPDWISQVPSRSGGCPASALHPCGCGRNRWQLQWHRLIVKRSAGCRGWLSQWPCKRRSIMYAHGCVGSITPPYIAIAYISLCISMTYNLFASICKYILYFVTYWGILSGNEGKCAGLTHQIQH